MLESAVLRKEGMNILSVHLGIVEAERFITLVKQEDFDYTEWQQNLYKDIPLRRLLHDAAEFRKNTETNNSR